MAASSLFTSIVFDVRHDPARKPLLGEPDHQVRADPGRFPGGHRKWFNDKGALHHSSRRYST